MVLDEAAQVLEPIAYRRFVPDFFARDPACFFLLLAVDVFVLAFVFEAATRFRGDLDTGALFARDCALNASDCS